MNKIIKKNILRIILVVVLTDIVIGCVLFKSRLFSHLAIWRITETGKQSDFYWPPENAPRCFRFESKNPGSLFFSNDIYPFLGDTGFFIKSLYYEKKPLPPFFNDEFKIVLKTAKYTMEITPVNGKTRLPLKLDSPRGMVEQMRKGVPANCIFRSIVFSSYLSSLGIKSRLWALENDNFNGIAHTVVEVYVNSIGKWVFLDITFGFFATEKNGNPLTLIEFREKALNGHIGEVNIYNIDGEIQSPGYLPNFYSRLLKCAFLRSNNDFINKYNAEKRYGVFAAFYKYLDRLPDYMRRGLDYSIGNRDVFVHYVDRHSKSFKLMIFIAKSALYFFIFSFLSICIFLAAACFFILKRILSGNLSRKETRQR